MTSKSDMKLYVAYVRQTRPTGRNIAKLLKATNWGIKEPEYLPDVLVRWGSSRDFPSADVELNSASAIRLASNKLRTLEILKGQVPVIPFFSHFQDVISTDVPIFGRSFSGHGGKDINVYNTYADAYERGRLHNWYSTYVPSSREVRIHVVGDSVVRVQGKYLDFPDQDKSNGYIRNYANGYRFRKPKENLHHSRHTDAIKCIQLLGLDFGAVDMLINIEDTNNHAILEVNTAPSCSPLTARCYGEALSILIKQRMNNEVSKGVEG